MKMDGKNGELFLPAILLDHQIYQKNAYLKTQKLLNFDIIVKQINSLLLVTKI